MKYIQKLESIETYYKEADFIDIKVFQGNTTLRQFIASMLSYYPWWIVQLYRIRKLLAGILDLAKHETPQELPNLRPEDFSFTSGENVTFFTVRSAVEDLIWMSETPDDKHLKAYFNIGANDFGMLSGF